MNLDKTKQYVFRIGSDNQHRLHWDGKTWRYEFLAGGVLFDEMTLATPEDVENAIGVHGLSLDQFSIDQSGAGEEYSREIQDRIRRLEEAGVAPCPKHGLMAKNLDNSCEACLHPDYFDDFKGTEG